MQIQIDKYTWVVGERVIPHCFMVSRNVILNVVRWTQVLHGSGGQLHNCLQYAQGGGRNDPS